MIHEGLASLERTAMSRSIQITRKDYTSEGLRQSVTEVRRARTAEAGTRMSAIANVLEGKSRAESARLAGMTAPTLHDGVHRYKAQGLEGLDSGKTTIVGAVCPAKDKGTGLVLPYANTEAMNLHVQAIVSLDDIEIGAIGG